MALNFKASHSKDFTLDNIDIGRVTTPEKASHAISLITDAMAGYFRNSLIAADGRVGTGPNPRLDDFGNKSQPVLPEMGEQGFSRATLRLAANLSSQLAPDEDDPDIVEAVTHPELGLHALLQLIAHGHAQHRSAPHTLNNLAVLSGDVYSTSVHGLGAQPLNQLDWNTDGVDETPSRKKVLAERRSDLEAETLNYSVHALEQGLRQGVGTRTWVVLSTFVVNRATQGQNVDAKFVANLKLHLLTFMHQQLMFKGSPGDLTALENTINSLMTTEEIMRLEVRE